MTVAGHHGTKWLGEMAWVHVKWWDSMVFAIKLINKTQTVRCLKLVAYMFKRRWLCSHTWTWMWIRMYSPASVRKHRCLGFCVAEPQQQLHSTTQLVHNSWEEVMFMLIGLWLSVVTLIQDYNKTNSNSNSYTYVVSTVYIGSWEKQLDCFTHNQLTSHEKRSQANT